jgi:hypothetical protein
MIATGVPVMGCSDVRPFDLVAPQEKRKL